jgi:hypothetical protein
MSSRIVAKLNAGKKLLLGSAGLLAVVVPISVGVINAPFIRAQSLRRSLKWRRSS